MRLGVSAHGRYGFNRPFSLAVGESWTRGVCVAAVGFVEIALKYERRHDEVLWYMGSPMMLIRLGFATRPVQTSCLGDIVSEFAGIESQRK